MTSLIGSIGILLFLVLLRLYWVLPATHRNVRVSRRAPSSTCSLAIFLGSGGHSSEALLLASALDFTRYSPRTYVISEGDTLSVQKALALEASKTAGTPSPAVRRFLFLCVSDSDEQVLKQKIGNEFTLLTIPRARRVHQPLLTTPPTAVFSLLVCMYHVTMRPLLAEGTFRRPFADVLLLNGPGTCVMLCGAAFLNKFMGLPSPTLIYIESFARVQSLSLSGKLVRPFVDRFIVQWPELLQDGGRGEFIGWLV